LNAVIGFADILTNQYFGDLNPRQLDYSRGILQSSQQLLELIENISDLATIEAGYMVLETGRVEIFEMLTTVLALTRGRAKSRGLDIELCCPPEIGAIAADERRLKQALFNLISNAIKFTPPGGSIRIEAERRESELLLIVADSGTGIPPADHARMFEKFERGTPRSGAGLGLSLVKNLIDLHGGAVTIDSAVGQGTTITCRLPTALREFAGMPPSTKIESRAAA
jgi:signal transduction histidine kinase